MSTDEGRARVVPMTEAVHALIGAIENIAYKGDNGWHNAKQDWVSLTPYIEPALAKAQAALASSESNVLIPDALKEMEERKDAAYKERNQVVAALAWMALFMGWKAGIARTAIEGWSDDWHGCVYIDLPSGQVSWHFHDSHAAMFTYLPKYEGKWDGHTTEQKYLTLTALCSWRDTLIPKAGRAPVVPCPNCKGLAEAHSADLTEIGVLRAEVERLDGALARAKLTRFLPEGDNHHNAVACPYCNPDRMVLVPESSAPKKDIPALAALRGLYAHVTGIKPGTGDLHALLNDQGTVKALRDARVVLDPGWTPSDGWGQPWGAGRAPKEREHG